MTRTSGPVLVVDDDADVRLLAARAIREAGHRALTALDGDQALRLVGDGGLRPALVIVDQSMPGRDGLSVVRAMRAMAAHASTPIVMFTTRLGDDLRAAAKAAGADDSVAKPSEVGQFHSVIRALLRRWVAAPAPG